MKTDQPAVTADALFEKAKSLYAQIQELAEQDERLREQCDVIWWQLTDEQRVHLNEQAEKSAAKRRQKDAQKPKEAGR